jgi:spermidine dehydrogenase
MPGLFDSSRLDSRRVSFPGGNSGFVRYFLKYLTPDAISGGHSFEEIITNPVDPAALDRPGQPVRMRTSCTVLSVAHDGRPSDSEAVNLIYIRDGRYYGLRAKSVVMATGSWMTKQVVRDLPERHLIACSSFLHAPFLVANVALTNWRFLHKLGCTAAIWNRDDDGFGFTCNIRNPMQVGQYKPPLDPDQPTVLSFYTPFHRPGLDPKTQVAMGRAALLSTSYAAYEAKILKQMVRLFGPAGFDPYRDVGGLILNRWGHAYSVPYPGFYGGATGQGPGDILRGGFGRVGFAHSELAGLQHYGPAADEGRRAYQQVAGMG